MPSTQELIPPDKVLPSYARGTDFEQVGGRFLEFAAASGLRPDHRVLDLGCGVGRFAVALAGYLDERGRYVGLDTSTRSIRICRKWIGSKLPNFSFERAKVYNTRYNPNAWLRAAEYRFPFADRFFDYVFSNSLFTHLVPDDAENYILEIGRVLDLGGTTLNTIFLLNEESIAWLDSEQSRQGRTVPFADGLARVKQPERPESWIAHEEGLIRRAHDRAGLRIVEPVRYGDWCGREASGPGFSAKDIVVAVKERHNPRRPVPGQRRRALAAVRSLLGRRG